MNDNSVDRCRPAADVSSKRESKFDAIQLTDEDREAAIYTLSPGRIVHHVM